MRSYISAFTKQDHVDTAFLDANRRVLMGKGIAFYAGRHIRRNHAELHVASMWPERKSPFRLRLGDVAPDYNLTAASEISRFRSETDAHTILFSSEGLSYLRHPEEMNDLRRLLDTDDIVIIAYLREPSSWLESYKAQLEKQKFLDDEDKDSFACVIPDSWLLDFDKRISRSETRSERGTFS